MKYIVNLYGIEPELQRILILYVTFNKSYSH